MHNDSLLANLYQLYWLYCSSGIQKTGNKRNNKILRLIQKTDRKNTEATEASVINSQLQLEKISHLQYLGSRITNQSKMEIQI